MQNAKPVTILNVKFCFGETEDAIHPVVLQDGVHTILIDCGYTGFLPAIETAMQEDGISCKDLTHVLITHHDHDHMGALSALKKKYPHIQVVAGEYEEPYISGRLKSMRLAQAEAMQLSLPEDQQAFGIAFCNILKNVEPVPVDRIVHGGDVLDWVGGCTVLDTPGHTPGHISLYLNDENIMIAGDAAVVENEKLEIANPQFTLDMQAAAKSLKQLLKYGAAEVICYHGGIYLPKDINNAN